MAQDALGAWGLYGGSSAQARGLEVVSRNPALMADPASDGFYFGLASLGLEVGNNTLSLSRYNELSGAVLDEQAKERLLSEIPAGGLRLQGDLDASLLGVRKGRFALSARLIGVGGGNIDRDVIELVLLGNRIEQAFSFEDTDGQGYAYGAATLSYAHPLPARGSWDLSLGANLSYLQGIFEMHALEASGGLLTTIDGLDGSARAEFLSSTGGSGYSLDLGFSALRDEHWRLGLMWEGLLGSLNWDGNVQQQLWTARAEGIQLGQDDLDSAVEKSDSSWVGDPYSTRLPQALRLGILRQGRRFSMALETELRIVGLQGAPTGPAVVLGGEWMAWPWLRTRLGLGFGSGAEGAVAGLGLRFGAVLADFYGGVRGGYIPSKARGLTLGSALSLDF